MNHKMSDNKQDNPKLFYGWIVVIALTFVGMSSAAQLTFGIYVLDLAREFGWNRALISSLASFNNLFYGISAIVTGILADRYSPRITVWVAGFLLGGGLLLSGMANNYWQLFFFFGVIAGLGTGCCYSIPSSVVQKWFIEKRGVALGISMCGIGLGAFIISLLVGYLIPIYGWRTGFFAEGVLLFLFMFVPAFFIVREPREIGLLPLGMKSNHPDNGLNPTFTSPSS
jgi:OFA family oxalate/formate antiporter-like MFS transporter